MEVDMPESAKTRTRVPPERRIPYAYPNLKKNVISFLASNWLAARRWVVPHYELVVSEQRESDAMYVKGYRSRVYSAIPHFAVVNTQPQMAFLFVSFKGNDGSPYQDMAYEGSLGSMESVEFNLADHDKLKIPKLKETAKSGDLFWFRVGWFDIHSSVEVQVDAWIEYYENPMWAQVGQHWARPLAILETSYIRDDAWFPRWEAKLAPRE
jgi:hypothetical protein